MDISWLRHFRIGPFSLFDFAATYIGVFIFALLFKKLTSKLHIPISISQWLWLALPIGVLAHLLTGQRTILTSMFLDLKGHYSVKLIILFMLFMGLKDIIKALNKKFNA